MSEEEYDVFLEQWVPSERLIHATLPQHVEDPWLTQELFEGDGGDLVQRTPWTGGTKRMLLQEERARRYDFFIDRQPKWSAHFVDQLLSFGMSGAKVDHLVHCFRTLWVDGARRQTSSEMMAIKASIQAHDQATHRLTAGSYVKNEIPSSIAPCFTVSDVDAIFRANSCLLEAMLPEYVDALGVDGPGSVSGLHVHRGVHMPEQQQVRRELYYLSSFSLAIGPPEQFAQQWTSATNGTGTPTIFSAPLPAIQSRVMAFAPFIPEMMLDQLELVVAPPVSETRFSDDGVFGGIVQRSFR